MGRLGLLTAGIALIASIGSRASASRSESFVVLLIADPPATSGPGAVKEFQAAKERVHDLLFRPGAVIRGRPWYRFGQDTITIVESGPGPRSTENASAAQGHWDLIDSDYARLLTRPRIRLRESRFLELFHPSPRPHQFDLDRTLEASQADWQGRPPVLLVVLRQVGAPPPRVSDLVAARFDRIRADFKIEREHQDRFGDYVVERAEIAPGGLASPAPPVASESLGLRLWKAIKTLFRVLLVLAAATAVAAAGRWVWLQRFRARHFELWIPGFAGAFPLPRPGRDVHAEFRARLPRYAGEPAVHLQLPSRLIRAVFYPGAKLKWDSRLRVDGLAPELTESKIGKLPRFVRLLWVERPADEGSLSLSIERPRMLGGNERIDIAVKFLALAQSNPETRVPN